MLDEKKAKIKALRQRIANLKPEEKAALLGRGLIATIDGRLLSPYNTMMIYFQSTHGIPVVVGGYKQWRAAGRHVKKGEHGYTILFPVGEKTEDGDIISAERFYTATVFDISQTEETEARIKEAAAV